MTAFAAGFVLDLLIGDPHWMPHPVRLIGRWIGGLDRRLLGDLPAEEARDPQKEHRKGAFLVLIVLFSTGICTGVICILAYLFSVKLGFAVESILTCYVLAATSLRRDSLKVYDALARGDLAGARKAVSMIVGRDTDVLDEAGVTRAAVETVAENLSDGVIAPMLYAAIGGPVLGMLYKAVNTMDSMIGYRNDRYRWFGTAAAKLDDAVNYVPARISALLLIVAAAVSGPEYSAGRAYRIWRRDRRKHKSPNAAQPESACAGALGLALAGDAQYFGKVVHKPQIGDPVRPIEPEDIRRANHLMTIASVTGELLCLFVMFLILHA